MSSNPKNDENHQFGEKTPVTNEDLLKVINGGQAS